MSMLSNPNQQEQAKMMQQKQALLARRCQEGDKGSCQQLKFGNQNIAARGLDNQSLIGVGMSGRKRAEAAAWNSGWADAYKEGVPYSASGVKYQAPQKAAFALDQINDWIASKPRSEREAIRDQFVDTVNQRAQHHSSKYAMSTAIQEAVNSMAKHGYDRVMYQDPGAGRVNLKYGSEEAERFDPNKKYAEGGEVMNEEALLAPPEMMMEEPPMEDQGLEWAPLAEVLGEAKFTEVAMLAQEFPVVAELAEMAMKTSDGFVEGEGGPEEDMVPARLSDGEFVFSAAAVEEIGLEKLEQMHEEARAKAGAM